MSFPNEFPSHFGGQFASPQRAVLANCFANAAPMTPQEFSHNPQDVEQRALCLYNSFPSHPDDPSAAKIHLSRFISTNGFIFDHRLDDHQLPREVILRACKGGVKCLWCLTVFRDIDAAFDCVRRHIGHRPYPCAGACPMSPQGCGARFCRNADLQAHQGGH